MMRSIATTAAGVAGGHLAANAIMGMVSGGKSEEPAPVQGNGHCTLATHT